jgi:uncharacterized protein
MLIEFSVGNFRSFQDLQTLRLQTAPIKSKNPALDEQNIFAATDKIKLVKTKVLYGANASGKSNLIKAMEAFIKIVQGSLQHADVLKNMIVPYLLHTSAFQQPTYFQIRFHLDGLNYRYGFEASTTKIISEWLYSSGERGGESYYFKRDQEGLTVNAKTFKEASRLITGKDNMPPLYRENVLFLPLVALFNGPVATKIMQYFSDKYAVYGVTEDVVARTIAADAFSDERMRMKMTDVLMQADLGVEGMGIMEIPPDELNEEAKVQYQNLVRAGKTPVTIVTKRYAMDESGNTASEIPFLLSDESYGTQKLFWVSPFLIGALEHGGVLAVDEFGSSLHVRLIRAIIQLFHSPETNPHNAQLIVATHDTHLLDQAIFRRDQIAFVEKSRNGQSVLTDLVEFKSVRNDASLERDYLHGKYGAVPFVNQFGWAFTPENHGEKH